MKHRAIFLVTALFSLPLFAATSSNQGLQSEVEQLKKQTTQLQKQLEALQKELVRKTAYQAARSKSKHTPIKKSKVKQKLAKSQPKKLGKANPLHGHHRHYHNSVVTVHSLDRDPAAIEFYPTALIADNHVVTYIAGTPVVTSPYLGARPAFDGSDFIVNISSINRDIRLMQQRRRLFRANEAIGYPMPTDPIVALSGKVEPVASIGGNYNSPTVADLTIGSGELDTAAILNDKIEGYLSFNYDETQPALFAGQRIANSRVGFNMGFVNIGDLDETPFYFTAGQLFAPFGRFSTSMISPPLTMILARTKTRPFIVGYKSQQPTGPFVALYGYSSDTTLGGNGVWGANVGYEFRIGEVVGELGVSGMSAINNSGGMQINGSPAHTTFAGFASVTNGSENVKKIPAMGGHADIRWERYNITAEWVGAISRFRPQDLSFNGQGALPQAAQIEGGMTFKVWQKPASVAAGYQWSQETLALNLPQHRISGVFNISIWKDTVESLEYRHDIDYKRNVYANGAAPPGVVNANTVGSGGSADTVLLQLGVYF